MDETCKIQHIFFKTGCYTIILHIVMFSTEFKKLSFIVEFLCFLAATESQIPVPDCETEGYLKYLFLVRAVNVGANNVTHYGNWSSPGESNCYSSGNKIPVIILPWSQGSGVRKQGNREDFELRMGIEASQGASVNIPHGFEGGEVEGSGLLQESTKDIEFDWYCGPRKPIYSKQEMKKLHKLLLWFNKYVIHNK